MECDFCGSHQHLIPTIVEDPMTGERYRHGQICQACREKRNRLGNIIFWLILANISVAILNVL